MAKQLNLAAVFLTSLALTGCVSNAESVMTTDTEMREVVNEFYGSGLDLRSPRGVSHGERDLGGYTRDAIAETKVLFPRLPNPVMAMYVYPHLTGDDTPIPGYTVPLEMFDSAPYALPGETGGWEQ